MKDALVSVIVPIYQVEKYLEECIESIRKQTYCNLDIILVDDGSKDASASICDEYMSKDERIRVIHQENKGLSAARNAGIEVAQGEYYIFIDSDDYIHSQMVEILLNVANKTTADVVYCDYTYKEEGFNNSILVDNIKYVKYSQAEMSQKVTDVERTPVVIACNKLYRKKLFQNIRYSEGRLHEDEFIIHRLYDQCNLVCSVPYKLYFYRQRGGSITGNLSEKSVIDKMDSLKERVDFYKSKSKMIYSRACAIYFYTMIWLYFNVTTRPLKGKILVRYRAEYIEYVPEATFTVLRKWKLKLFFKFPRAYVIFYWLGI